VRKSTDKGPIPRRLRFGAPQESDFQPVGNLEGYVRSPARGLGVTEGDLT